MGLGGCCLDIPSSDPCGVSVTPPPLMLFALLVSKRLCLAGISVYEDHLGFRLDYMIVDVFKELVKQSGVMLSNGELFSSTITTKLKDDC